MGKKYLKILIKSMFLFVAISCCTFFCSCLACRDYGYEYNFSVVGGNGEIFVKLGDELYSSSESPLRLLGGKVCNHNLEFVAYPDEGYQVKNWVYNGEIVEENKSNTLFSREANNKNNVIVITVEFEPIPDLNI